MYEFSPFDVNVAWLCTPIVRMRSVEPPPRYRHVRNDRPPVTGRVGTMPRPLEDACSIVYPPKSMQCMSTPLSSRLPYGMFCCPCLPLPILCFFQGKYGDALPMLERALD
ncbi:unnamed protein product, partial [Ectocarpus fasciculatus]